MNASSDLGTIADLDAATAHLQAPLAAVDLAALRVNADDLVRRAAGKPIRLATKSVRCRAVLDRVLDRRGFRGLMAYSLAEAIWLARNGATDILVAYPTTDLESLDALSRDERLRDDITVMVDDPAHLEIIEACTTGPIRVCIDIDASLRIGPLHLGVRRSPLHRVDEVLGLIHQALGNPKVRIVGLMCYDAQVAGVPDTSLAVRLMKRRSLTELTSRRSTIVSATREEVDLEFVNVGGTGSLDVMSQQPDVTEVTAGSGLFGPTLFDQYRGFTCIPALAYALPVVRAPAPEIRTVFSGGFPASGPAGASRLPTPIWPAGLRLLRTEGAGEVQTPVTGAAAAKLAIGDRVWWRHAKAGEICERFASLTLVDLRSGSIQSSSIPTSSIESSSIESSSIEIVPTYRGEGKCFG